MKTKCYRESISTLFRKNARAAKSMNSGLSGSRSDAINFSYSIEKLIAYVFLNKWKCLAIFKG